MDIEDFLKQFEVRHTEKVPDFAQDRSGIRTEKFLLLFC